MNHSQAREHATAIRTGIFRELEDNRIVSLQQALENAKWAAGYCLRVDDPSEAEQNNLRLVVTRTNAAEECIDGNDWENALRHAARAARTLMKLTTA